MDYGAYGLVVEGMTGDPAHAGLVPVPADWPRVTLSWEPLDGRALPDNLIDDERLRYRLLGGGYVTMTRADGCVTFATEERLDDASLAHPGLAPVGGVQARWRGFEAFHGAGVVIDGGAWAVLADKEVCKSTTVAALARAGHEVVADDLVVVDQAAEAGPVAFAGPRFADLREPTARWLQRRSDVELTPVRGGERWRLPVGAASSAAWPLRGFVLLTEGPQVRAGVVPAGQRLPRLTEHRAVRLLPRDPVGLLDLMALPAVELARPRTWEALDATVDALVETASRPG